MKRLLLPAAWAAALLASGLVCAAAPQSPEDQLLFNLYKPLVEIDTSDATGDTTRAARAMAAGLKAGGIPADDIQIIVPPGAPKKGNLVARLRGSGAQKPLLLLAHIDVVNAKREDWERDPFKLVEENGYYYGRGAADNKAMASAITAILIRLRQEKYVPNRDIIVALTSDEEIIPSRWNGIDYLLRNHRSLVDAAIAINEGGTGQISREGKYLYHGIQAGEKTFQTFRLEVTNPGGHSARPSKDNAIYHLAGALARLGTFDFPVNLTEVNRAYFERAAKLESGQLAADMRGIVATPPDAAAVERMSRLPNFNSLMRTTCVATMLDAGHATNALPQRARAVVNCRILPGETVDEVERTLVRVLANDKIRITRDGDPVVATAPPLSQEIMGPVTELTARLWPGVPVIPTMSAGATDARFLSAAGIPTYGITGQFREATGGGVHGLNERIRVSSVYEGYDFLYRLVKALTAPR